jgi:hypothetical protein
MDHRHVARRSANAPGSREKDQTLELDLGQLEKSEPQLSGLDAVGKQVRCDAIDDKVDEPVIARRFRESEAGCAHERRGDVGGGALHGVVEADQFHFVLNVSVTLRTL